EQADAGRKEARMGWSKLGMTAEQVEALKADLAALAELDAAEEGFEASAEELEAQAGRPSNKPAQDAAEDAEAQERAVAKAESKKDPETGEPRGGLTRLVESLLMDAKLSY